MGNTSPLESAEQIALVEWLELQGLKFTAIPNSTFTRSWSVKRRNYREGLRPGLADLFIIVPRHKSADGEGYALYIEMKRQRGGVLSADQKAWQEAINGLGIANIQSYVCKGAESAIATVSHYLKAVDNSVF